MVAAQETWARAFLETLLDLDTRRIFTVLVYMPFEGRNRSADTLESAEQRPRFYRVNGALDIEWLLAREWDAEAGNMVLSCKSSVAFALFHADEVKSMWAAII